MPPPHPLDAGNTEDPDDPVDDLTVAVIVFRLERRFALDVDVGHGFEK